MTEKQIFDYLVSNGLTKCGAAGLMGNLYAESGLRSNNLQNYYERALGMNDEQYTYAVDTGKYTEYQFVHDAAGYGLAQWTYYTRKQALYNYVRSTGKSIGDCKAQCDFLVKELKNNYGPIWNILAVATDIQYASDMVLTQYERPADQSQNMKNHRAQIGKEIYARCANMPVQTPQVQPVSASASTQNSLNVQIVEAYTTNNPCYKANGRHSKKGLMLHSIGVGQPNAQVLVNGYNNPNLQAAVHAFIDGNTGVVFQTLPWDMRAWHAGGAANDTHLGIEMCEPSSIKYASGATFVCSDYASAIACAKRTYDSAVKLFAMLCKMYSLNPLQDGVIISHYEGYKRGVASGHMDPEHLWRQLGMTDYSMDRFRRDVASAMGHPIVVSPTTNTGTSAQIVPPSAQQNIFYRVQVGSFRNRANAEDRLSAIKKDAEKAFSEGRIKNDVINTINKGKVFYIDRMFKVQVGSFQNKNNAMTLCNIVRTVLKYDAFVCPVNK